MGLMDQWRRWTSSWGRTSSVNSNGSNESRVHRVVTDEGIKSVSDESAARFMRYYTDVPTQSRKPDEGPEKDSSNSKCTVEHLEEKGAEDVDKPLTAMKGNLLDEVNLLYESINSGEKSLNTDSSSTNSLKETTMDEKPKQMPVLLPKESESFKPELRLINYEVNNLNFSIGDCLNYQQDDCDEENECLEYVDQEVWDSICSISSILNRMQYFLVNTGEEYNLENENFVNL